MPDYTIDGWCMKHRVCRATYYNLKNQGKAPREIRIGSRPRITEEDDAAWVAQRRSEAQRHAALQPACSRKPHSHQDDR